MTSILRASLFVLLIAAPAAAEPRPPVRITNASEVTAYCNLVTMGSGMNERVLLKAGETLVRRIPASRDIRLVCLRSSTRETALAPGIAYRLVQADGRLQLTEDTEQPH